jgi:transposase
VAESEVAAFQATVSSLQAAVKQAESENLAWLAQHQEAIEQRLFRRRYGDAAPQLFLYDVTSSYLEGVNNVLAAFGYNRDGKKGKQQLVIGLHLKMEHHLIFNPAVSAGKSLAGILGA